MSVGLLGSLNSQGDLYARSLGAALRSYRLNDPDYALRQDAQVYERMRHDPVIGFALRLRKLLAAGRDWYMEPAGSEQQDRLFAKILEDGLRHIEYFDAARFNLAEAIIAGSRWARIEGELKSCRLGGLEPRQWVVPTRLLDVDKRRFRQFPVERGWKERRVPVLGADGTVTEQVVQERVREWVWQLFRPLQQHWEEIDRDDYVRHINDDREDNLGYGGGLASELYHFWYAKEVVLQHGLQYIERWSQGFLIAKVETLRDGNASLPTSDDRMAKWLTVLEKMRSRHVLVHDARDSIDVKDAPQGGWDAALEALKYLDGAMRVAVLGSTLPTQADVKGGSYALADVQAAVTNALTRFDQAGEEESLRRDLIGWFVRHNWPTLVSLGLQTCQLPFLKIREDRKDNHEARANVIVAMLNAGLKIRAAEVYPQVGLTPPMEGDELLEARPGQVGPATPLPTPAPSEGANNATLPRSGQGGDRTRQGTGSMPSPKDVRPSSGQGPLSGAAKKYGLGERLGEGVLVPFVPRRSPEEDGVMRDDLAFALLDKMGKIADRPTRVEIVPKQDPPIVNVHVSPAPPTPVTVYVPEAAAPVVNVTSPAVHVAAPIVNVAPPVVHVAAPIVHVAAAKVTLPTIEVPVPIVHVEAPVVNVMLPAPSKKVVDLERRPDGSLHAEIVTAPAPSPPPPKVR